MSSKKSKKKITINHKKKNMAIIVTIIFSMSLFDIFSPFGGNIRFYAKWHECGSKPVSERVALSFGATPESYEDSQTIAAYRMQARYFCTPLEAEKAGYSANPDRMEFPNLDKEKSGQ